MKKFFSVLGSVLCVLIFLFTTILTSCKDGLKNENIVINFTDHIAPIIFKNCTPCHRTKEAGPFSLLNYSDIKWNINKIKYAISTKYMPPWPADPNYTHFIGERVLSKSEVELIIKWAQNGMIAGDTSKLKPPIYFEGSFFRKPDLIVKLNEPVYLKGNGEDNFLIVKLPYEIPKDTFVSFLEFVPGKRKLIHHVNGHTISFSEGKKRNLKVGKSVIPDIQDNFELAFGEMGLKQDDGTFPLLTPGTIYYLPGYTPPVYPEGIGGYFFKRKGAFLLKNIHYGPAAKDTYDSSCINVFYRPIPPKRPTQEIQLGTFGISEIVPEFIIPANEIKTFRTNWTTPRDLSLLSINPHMHLLGRKFLSFAVTPNNDTIPIIRINKWDFRWQYYYTFKKPLKIPSGSVIYAFATFDNTKYNLFNPFSPPQTFYSRKGKESMKTSEEMFQLILNVIPYLPGDEKIILDKH